MEHRRVALVTGSATGIGRAVVWRLAERGYDIMVNYSRSKAEAEETADGVRTRGTSVAVVQADVADDTMVRVLVERTVSPRRSGTRSSTSTSRGPSSPAARRCRT
jgi:3-oxoacyl-[acyl-carrier protein] reductase